MADAGACLVESYPVSDTYADGLGRIETTGQNLRLVFFTARPRDDGTLDREIVERVIIPAEALIPALVTMLALPSMSMQIMAAFTEYLTRQHTGMLN